MASEPRDLSDIRRDIDGIDRQLLDLLCRRLDCSLEVADYKAARGLPVLNQQREDEILTRVRQEAPHGYGEAAALVFAAAMDVSRGLQHRRMAAGQALRQQIRLAQNRLLPPSQARVVCAGRPGAYAHEAALRMFPGAPLPHFVHAFSDVFSAVEKGEADYGVIPVENSSAGSVNEVYDLILAHRFTIAAAAEIPIHHCLLGIPGTRLSNITAVYSHHQALEQCADYIKAHHLEPRQYSNTAAAAEMVSLAADPTIAAVASKTAADLYKLDILDDNIQTVYDNSTRFIAISSQLTIPQDADKISLIFTLPHVTGSLYRVLARFAMEGLNLTKIESRPQRSGGFEYIFYLDFVGSLQNPATVDLLCALSEEMPVFSFLGNYRELDIRRS